jgi:predicted amidohydrolase
MQSQTSRAAVAQLRSTSDKVSNLLDVAKCAGWAKREGASMLFLPECFGFLGEGGQQTLSRAEPPLSGGESAQQHSVKGPIFDALKLTVSSYANGSEQVADISESSVQSEVSLLDGLKTIARESGCWLSAGGMHESGAPPAATGGEENEAKSRVYNSHVIIDSYGVVKSTYRKSHLFDVSIPNKVNLRESATTAPGEDLVVCDSPIGRLGLSTCYDVRFPEMYVDLVQRGGAEILLVPSAFTIPTGKAHWHTLLTGE